MEAFKNSIKDIPGVINIAAATAVPNRNNNTNGYMIEGRLDESLLMATSWVDYDHIDTYQMEILEGRFFSRDFPADIEGCILNESAIKEFGIENPFSTRIMAPLNTVEGFAYMPIIGVVKDFNHVSLQRKIQPYIMRFRTDAYQFGYLTARVAPENLTGTIEKIEEVWKEFTLTDAMPYFFMDEEFNRIYMQERQSARLTIIFALFAIIVASMGLFGLTSFMLQQRTKEIGVRKAMGASVSTIFNLITKDILLLVTIAAVIGSPLIYFFADKWLENYYFRINIEVWEFLLGYFVAIGIAIATISFRTLKAANISPAQSLKRE